MYANTPNHDRASYSLSGRPYTKTPHHVQHSEFTPHNGTPQEPETVSRHTAFFRDDTLKFNESLSIKEGDITEYVLSTLQDGGVHHVDGASLVANVTEVTTPEEFKSITKKKDGTDNLFSLWPYKHPSYKPKSTVVTKEQSDFIRASDLDEILRASGYVRHSDLKSSSSSNGMDDSSNKQGRDNSKSGTEEASKKRKGEIAFPRSSILSYRHVTVGSTISGGLMGLFLGITIYPNLWLVGTGLGGTYGYDVAHKVASSTETQSPSSLIPRSILSTGRLLARSYLNIYDTLNGMWFMYKTGQLSYEYYKRYSQLDKRFHVQDKVDAWNARFQQGKINFDRWEKENEVGRKILATLRTAWLVQEDSYKKEQRRYGRKSPYRVVRYGYKVMAWLRKLVSAMFHAMTGGGSSELQQLLTGIRISLAESRWQEWSPRAGGAVAALVACYCVGVVFAVAPTLLTIVAITTGMLFPNWLSQTYDEIGKLVEETRAKGRDEDSSLSTASANGRTTSRSSRWNSKASKGSTRAVKDRYHFYVRKDGTKHWYRTGQPFSLFDRTEKESEKKGIFGLWNSEESKKDENKSNLRWRFWGF